MYKVFDDLVLTPSYTESTWNSWSMNQPLFSKESIVLTIGWVRLKIIYSILDGRWFLLNMYTLLCVENNRNVVN